MANQKLNVLFMCVANSARSQLAEGLATQLFPERLNARSAGSNPSQLNPFAVRAMADIGGDISHHFSKTVQQIEAPFLESLDLVITLCAEEVCPVFVSAAKRLHWPIPDPAGQGSSDEERLTAFRTARDSIRQRLEAFLAS